MSTGRPRQQTSSRPDVLPIAGSGPAPTDLAQWRPDDKQIAEIVDRLHRRYPGEQISEADIEGRVRRCFHEFGGVRIRTFVGIFVERVVRRSIENPTIANDAVGSATRR